MKNLLIIFLLISTAAKSQVSVYTSPQPIRTAMDSLRIAVSERYLGRTYQRSVRLDSIKGIDSVVLTGQTLYGYKNGTPKAITTVLVTNFTSLKNGDYLKYDSASTRWVNVSGVSVVQRFDSIGTFTGSTLPSGNIGLSTTDNRIHYRPGNNYEYRLGVLDSTQIVSAGVGTTVAYSQNFDAATPPALPSGWVGTSGATTSTAQSISASNSLSMATNGGAVESAIYNTTDPASGQVTIRANFRSTSGNAEFLLLGRASTTSFSTMSAYGARLWINNASGGTSSGLGLNKGASLGTNLVPTSVGQGTTFANGEWYEISMTLSGTTTTTITIQAKRVSDGFYLNSSGTFVSGVQNAITYVDSSSPITGAGYSGIATYVPSGSGNYIDNFSILQ